MRYTIARLIAPLLLVPCLVACVPGQTTPTPQLVIPPPSNVTTTIVVITSTPPPDRTATPPLPPGTTTPPIPISPTATVRSGVTPAPTIRAAPTATVRGGTPETALPRATKLTADGCCVLPRWLPDGGSIAFFAAAGQVDPRAGTWRVPRAGGAPALLSGLYGTFSPDMGLVAYPDGAVTRVARLDGAPLAAIPNDGRRAYLPATNDRVAWMIPAGGVTIVSPSLDPPFQIVILDLTTGATVTPPAVFIGETIQWFPDGRRILINGRDSRAEHPGLWVLDTVSGAATQIVESPWLESPAISPDGRQIVYTATLQPDAAANGVWIVGADGGGRRKLGELVGGYRWLPDNGNLLYIPAPTDRPTDELWRYTLADGSRTRLVGGEQALFTVAQNEWEVAPDGKALAYRSAVDGALWILQFAP